MLTEYLEDADPDSSVYFGGHRIIKGLYNLRAAGKYVQIHNPEKHVVAVLTPEKKFDPETDIVELQPFHLPESLIRKGQ
jgi:hypothetical protein